MQGMLAHDCCGYDDLYYICDEAYDDDDDDDDDYDDGDGDDTMMMMMMAEKLRFREANTLIEAIKLLEIALKTRTLSRSMSAFNQSTDQSVNESINHSINHLPCEVDREHSFHSVLLLQPQSPALVLK